jgi:hypothetical protein
MKRILFLLLSVCLSHLAFAQIKKVQILIEHTDSSVLNYFTYLFNLRNNKYYQTEKSITKDGDLVLQASFSISDQEFYTCSGVTAIFFRKDAKEYCIQQVVWGNEKYIYPNIAYIKDNFVSLSNNTWEKQIDSSSNKIKASITSKTFPDNSVYYYITFWLDQ